jgi:energy-converting hydrogenase Eha subunit E
MDLLYLKTFKVATALMAYIASMAFTAFFLVRIYIYGNLKRRGSFFFFESFNRLND